MNILYVLRSTIHYSFYESVIQALYAKGHKVHALFDKGWSESSRPLEQIRARAGTPLFTADWSLRRDDRWRRWIFDSREILSYSSYLGRINHSPYYINRWRGHLPAPLRVAAQLAPVRHLLAQPVIQNSLRSFERHVPPDPSICQWLSSNRPDVLIASPVNMRFSEEVEYVKAALTLGIPTVVHVLSWDNLTTKGLFHVLPDVTLAWNKRQKQEAVDIHQLPPGKVVVTGAPFFDKWLDAERLAMPRDMFCRRVGLNPDQPFLLYLGSSANVARDETWLVRDIARALREHPNPIVRHTSILVRPHPANARVYDEFVDGDNVHVWPKEGALPDSEQSLQDFYNSLRHCIASVGINTTGMIDAVIANRPCLTIMADRYRTTQLQATHFQYLLAANVLEITDSPAACADRIEKVLHGADATAPARERFTQEFARPYGVRRPAGHVAGCAIELAACGKSGVEIETELVRQFNLLPVLGS